MLSLPSPHASTATLDTLSATAVQSLESAAPEDVASLIARPVDPEGWWERRVERADARAERRGQVLGMVRSDALAVAQPAMGLLALAPQPDALGL